MRHEDHIRTLNYFPVATIGERHPHPRSALIYSISTSQYAICMWHHITIAARKQEGRQARKDGGLSPNGVPRLNVKNNSGSRCFLCDKSRRGNYFFGRLIFQDHQEAAECCGSGGGCGRGKEKLNRARFFSSTHNGLKPPAGVMNKTKAAIKLKSHRKDWQ